ncbi:Putative serine protease HhoA [Durusdinium trenchii]|uniref:Serine protease HhoA n=1 Tax=Durusdinium trenchii TaxID=1381693 RepID=A0ABP0RXE2_9DINO
MAPKRSAVVDVLARKGYYDEMTNTFEEINEKRDIVEKELQELVEEREELVKAIAELQARLEQIAVSNKANCKTLRKTERILRQLEQGGAVARAALRKLLLSRMTLEERVAKVREDFQLSCNWPASPVSRQRLKKEDLTMTRTEEDGSEVVLPMRSYCATGIEKPPVIVYFHGESYVAGTLDTHDWLCSALAQLSQAAVLSVEYRRPPEVRFPVPVDDAWAALQWAAAGTSFDQNLCSSPMAYGGHAAWHAGPWPGTVSRGEYLDRLYSQRSEQLAPARTQQRSLRAAGILESHGPVAMMPLSGAQVAHGIAIDQQKPSKVGQHSRQVKDNFVFWQSIEMNVNRVVEKCGPAVVRIQTEQKVELPAIANADLFSFFFGLRPDAERKIKGQGSGFCVDAEKGVILTNAHVPRCHLADVGAMSERDLVVQSADRITAHFAGRPGSGAHGSRGVGVECELLETDEVIDLAVLQVKEWEVHEFIDKSKLPLPAMSLGSSETVKTGDWTIVLGNPLGLQNTCTLGIVSSLDRSTGETGFDWMRHPLIQTDAAVNQGNSGGPMLNELGIISMRALFGEGIGFAIPVESIKGALPTLLARKKVPRSYIGVKSLGLHRMKFTDDSPAVIETVLEKSPAKEAKLQEEDQILEVNGHKVRHFDQIQKAVRNLPVGGQLKLKLKRGQERRDCVVNLR